MICRLLSAFSGTDQSRIRFGLRCLVNELLEWGAVVAVILFASGVAALIAWGGMMP